MKCAIIGLIGLLACSQPAAAQCRTISNLEYEPPQTSLLPIGPNQEWDDVIEDPTIPGNAGGHTQAYSYVRWIQIDVNEEEYWEVWWQDGKYDKNEDEMEWEWHHFKEANPWFGSPQVIEEGAYTASCEGLGYSPLTTGINTSYCGGAFVPGQWPIVNLGTNGWTIIEYTGDIVIQDSMHEDYYVDFAFYYRLKYGLYYTDPESGEEILSETLEIRVNWSGRGTSCD